VQEPPSPASGSPIGLIKKKENRTEIREKKEELDWDQKGKKSERN